MKRGKRAQEITARMKTAWMGCAVNVTGLKPEVAEDSKRRALDRLCRGLLSKQERKKWLSKGYAPLGNIRDIEERREMTIGGKDRIGISAKSDFFKFKKLRILRRMGWNWPARRVIEEAKESA